MTADANRDAEFETEALVHLDALYRTAHRLTGSPDDAHDLVQETYLRAYRFFHQFQKGTNCRAWLYKILRNAFVNRYEKQKRQPVSVDLDDVSGSIGALDPDLGFQPDSYEDMLGRILEDDVKAALMELPIAYRMVVVLADLETLSYKEIAEIVDVPIGTVMSRLHRGRKILRQQLVAAAQRYGIGSRGTP